MNLLGKEDNVMPWRNQANQNHSVLELRPVRQAQEDRNEFSIRTSPPVGD